MVEGKTGEDSPAVVHSTAADNKLGPGRMGRHARGSDCSLQGSGAELGLHKLQAADKLGRPQDSLVDSPDMLGAGLDGLPAVRPPGVALQEVVLEGRQLEPGVQLGPVVLSSQGARLLDRQADMPAPAGGSYNIAYSSRSKGRTLACGLVVGMELVALGPEAVCSSLPGAVPVAVLRVV